MLKVFQLLQRFLDLFLPALCFHPGNQGRNGSGICVIEDLIPGFLVIAGHLHSQVTAAGVDHNVEIPLFIFIHLNEVIAAAQGADALFRPQQIHMRGTVQLRQVDLAEIAMGLVPNGEAGRDFLINQLVQLLQLQSVFPDAGRLHAASDIHPHQIWHHFIRDGHGGADGAAFPRMNIRHQPDAAACCKFLIAQFLNLCD